MLAPPVFCSRATSFGTEDVDLPVQQTPLVGDLVLLARQIGDEQLEVSVGQRCEIGQRFHGPPFLVEGSQQ